MPALAGTIAIAALGTAASPERAPATVAVPAPGTYAWPVDGTVLRPFEPPGGPYAAGHRGIDIAAPAGTIVRAAEEGQVAFAGTVAGERHVSVDHPDGVRTSYAWLSSIAVRRGDRVTRGQPLGTTSSGHPGSGGTPHLHLGARFAGIYVDPSLLLEPRGVVGLVRLAPLSEGT